MCSGKTVSNGLRHLVIGKRYNSAGNKAEMSKLALHKLILLPNVSQLFT